MPTSKKTPTERDALLSSNTTADEDDDNEEDLRDDDERGFHSVQNFVHSIRNNALELSKDLFESVQEFAGDIVGEMEGAEEVFVDELVQADEQTDKYYLLEVGLLRGMSILPDDVVNAAAAMNASARSLRHRRGDSKNQAFGSLGQLLLPDAVVTPRAQSRKGQSQQQQQPAAMVDEEKPHLSSNSSVTEQEEEESTVTTDDNTSITTTKTVPITAYFLLASAVVSLSSVGALLALQEGVAPTMKLYWRTTATAILLFPLTYQAIRRDGFPQLSSSLWTMLVLAAFCYSAMCALFVMALNYTAVGNAVILSNTQALMLLIGKLFVGDRVSCLEAMGALVAFSGAVLCSKDSADVADAPGGQTLFGDLLALLSAVGGVGFLTFAKTVRSNMNLYVFMFCNMVLTSLYALLYHVLLGEKLTFDFDVNHGMFGWLNFRVDRLVVELIMAGVCNLFGAMGYIRAMQYFDNLVISVAALMEPVSAEFMAFALGVGFLPSWKGWLGNGLVAGGTLAVVYQPPTKAVPASDDVKKVVKK